jgi:ElaB/YqjD/DUF883 family membrane-anchored ribosome-binding protein
MNSHTPADQASRSASAHRAKTSETPPESPLATDLASPGGMTETVSQLSRDVARLKDTFAQLVSQVSDAGTKTVRGFGQTMASQVSSAATGVADTGSDLVSSAKGQAKTLASELEDMARRNPLGTIAGALLVGAVIGMMSRGRG